MISPLVTPLRSQVDGSVPRAKTILDAGLILGVVDAICAVVINLLRSPHGGPEHTFQSIAYAVIGKATYDGGIPTALLGLAMHFCVAFAWAAAYGLACRASVALRHTAERPFGVAVVGSLLGAIIWCSMNFIVFPLTRINGHSPITSPTFVIFFIQHVLVVGPLLVYMINRRGQAI